MMQTMLVVEEIETSALLITKGVEQFNGREGETATFKMSQNRPFLKHKDYQLKNGNS
jgi:hypothetical protein